MSGEHTTRRSDARWRLPAPESRAVFNERVLCLCVIHELSQTSAMRTREHNARVGGSVDSKHLLEFGGWAVDLVPEADLSASERQAVVIDARRFGLWANDETNHFHVQGKELGP